MEGLRGHVELVLLAVVAKKPAHGWAIIEQARLRSGGVLELLEGGVYLHLHRLEREGLADSVWSEVAGRSRRGYGRTRRGWAELAKRRADWGRVAHGMRTLLEES